MSLYFRNRTDAPIFVAYIWWTPGCGADPGADWTDIGWYRVDPGAEREVFRGDLDDVNRYWYYHIRSPQAGRIWAGAFPGWVRVPGPFNDCEGAVSTAQEPAGFREFDIGDAEDGYVNVIV